MIRARLVLRVYLIGLVQVAALAAALWLARPVPPGPRSSGRGHDALVRAAVDHLIESARDPAELQTRLVAFKRDSGVDVTIRDADGAIVASSGVPQRGGPGAQSIGVDLAGGRRALVTFPDLDEPTGRMAIPIGIILVLVGVSAVLTASWFGPPLAKLSQAARDLGAGNLAARANLRRNDELGEVAVAFDEMAERVAQVVQSQRELLANVSHELRTPLARIRVALDLAAEGDAQEAASSLREIAGDLGELERLVADVLTTARLALSSETASPLQPPLRSERIDARQLLEQAVARFRATHPDRELTLEFSTPDAPLDADLMLLRRAIDNLLDNAAKHSETRAAVALAAAIDDGRLRIEIRDQGTGIPAADLKRLFTPFFRADRSRTRQTGGLGLGLVLARRIVEAHRGSLEVESFPGRGTVARILVPLAS